MKRLPRILRYLWASPASAVGVLLSLFAFAAGATCVVRDGALEVAGVRMNAAAGRLPHGLRFGAITFGHVIIGASHAALAELRSHEHVHVRQYERWGVLFFPLYLGSSLWQIVCGRHPYWHNHFERQAYREAAAASEQASVVAAEL